MVGLKSLISVVVVLVSVVLWGQHVGAEMHHMAGDERGWDPNTDLTSWSSGRLFRVGDIIWFTYDAAQESVVELESIDELSSCDLKNPIKMYTEGLDKIKLDGEGSRYFASGNVENCKNGLKIHVKVHPKEKNETGHEDEPYPDAPSRPDGPPKPYPDAPSRPDSPPKPYPDAPSRPDGPPEPFPDTPSRPDGPPHPKDTPPGPPDSKDKDVPPPGPIIPPPSPPTPSASTHLGGLSFLLLGGLFLSFLRF